jgi:hypothetical protein
MAMVSDGCCYSERAIVVVKVGVAMGITEVLVGKREGG